MKKLLATIGVASLVWLWASPTAHAGSSDVVVIGDSILGLTRDELAPQLQTNGWTADITHTNGSGLTADTTITTGRDWVSTLLFADAVHHPDTVVIVLGTNDARAVAAGLDYRVHITELRAATRARRVLWATCSTHTAVPSINEGCGIINGLLRERTDLEVIPYDPDVTTGSNFGSIDSVHPGDGGQQAFADLISGYVGQPK